MPVPEPGFGAKKGYGTGLQRSDRDGAISVLSGRFGPNFGQLRQSGKITLPGGKPVRIREKTQKRKPLDATFLLEVMGRFELPNDGFAVRPV